MGTTEARDVSGLAQVLPTTPRKYEAVPIRAYLEKLRKRHLREAEGLALAAPDLEAMFPLEPSTTLADRGGILVVKGRQEALAAIRAAAAKATHDIFIVTSTGWTKRRQDTRAVVEGAQARGVTVRILAHPPENGDVDVAAYGDVAEVRARQYVEPGADAVSIYFFDGKKAILAHDVPDDASTTRGKDATLVVEEQALVAAIQCHAEARWEASPALRPEAARRQRSVR